MWNIFWGASIQPAAVIKQSNPKSIDFELPTNTIKMLVTIWTKIEHMLIKFVVNVKLGWIVIHVKTKAKHFL